MIWSVLTGDIVGSSDLSGEALDAVMHALEEAAADISRWPGLTCCHFGRRGGDGWQMAFDAPHEDLRASLYIASTLSSLEMPASTRIALARGAGEMPEGTPKDINAAHGPAFTASGRLLSDMPRRARLSHAEGGATHAAFLLADHIASGWTQAQARAMKAVLPPGTGPRSDIAHRLGITRQAVDQALRAAGYSALSAAMKALETP